MMRAIDAGTSDPPVPQVGSKPDGPAVPPDVSSPTDGPAPGGGLGGFGVLWVSQLISLVGSSLTGFVLGVWVYQTTGSATQFALISIASVVPAIAVAPFAGVLADRVDRRRIMVLADAGAGAATAVIALLLWTGRLEIWHIYLTAATAAAFNAAHSTAFLAMLPRLVPARQLGRANGLMQMVLAAQIAAPLLAGLLLETIGLRGVLVVDLGSMVVGITLLLSVRLSPAATRPPVTGAQVSLVEDLGHGLRYLWPRPGLRTLALVFGGFNFLFALAGVLVQPLILSFGSATTLGLLMFVGGAGLFIGSLVMSVWGGPRRRVRGILVFLVIGGFALILHAPRPSPWLIGVAAPLFLFTLPILNGTVMTIVQTEVRPASLGRVIATVQMLSQIAGLGAFVVAGPLVDRVAEPAMADAGVLADSFGSLIGTGEGRGMALVFGGIGAAMLLLAGFASTRPKLRALDHEPPETVPQADSPLQRSDPAKGMATTGRHRSGGVARYRPLRASTGRHRRGHH